MQSPQITKEARIAELQSKISWIKSNLGDASSPLHDIYQNKADLITGWAKYMEELHELGAYTKPVNTISTYIKTELRKMHLESAIPYVHEILDYKYKYDYTEQQKDSKSARGNPRLNGSLNIEEENEKYIIFVKKVIEFYKMINVKLHNHAFCSLLDQKLLEEHLLVCNELIEFGFEAWDEKQKVPLTTQHLLAACIASETANFGAGQYIKDVKKFGGITSKQSHKILKGWVRDKGKLGNLKFRSGILQMFNPKTKTEALHSGFYGKVCPKCGSWRVEYKYRGDIQNFQNYCYACGKWHVPSLVRK